MQITITISDAQKDRIIKSFTSQFGYQELLLDVEGNMSFNPETRSQFAKRMLVKMVKDAVRSWEATEAQRIACEASLADSDKLSIT